MTEFKAKVTQFQSLLGRGVTTSVCPKHYSVNAVSESGTNHCLFKTDRVSDACMVLDGMINLLLWKASDLEERKIAFHNSYY